MGALPLLANGEVRGSASKISTATKIHSIQAIFWNWFSDTFFKDPDCLVTQYSITPSPQFVRRCIYCCLILFVRGASHFLREYKSKHLIENISCNFGLFLLKTPVPAKTLSTSPSKWCDSFLGLIRKSLRGGGG